LARRIAWRFRDQGLPKNQPPAHITVFSGDDGADDV
jgi:hypothetical protein